MLKKTVIEIALKSAKTSLKEAKLRKKRIEKFISDYSDEINRIQNGAEAIKQWLIDVTIDTSSESLDFSYAGDKLVLKGIYNTFRKLGYKTSKTPQENATEFTAYWTHEESDMRIWIKFTSTVCTRKKVGTKMVEQDVFETVCE